MRGSSAGRAPASATATNISPALDGMVYGEDPSEGFVRGRRFLHPKLGFTFTGAAAASRSTTPRRRCSASRTAATRRCGSTSCSVPAEQTLPII